MTSLRKSMLAPLAPPTSLTPLDSVGPTLVPSAAPVADQATPTLPGVPDLPSTAAREPSHALAPLRSGGESISLSTQDEALTYRPTEAQQRVKARFWSRWADVAGREPTLAVIKQLTGSAALEQWWGKPGFKDWFLNTSVTEERLAYLLHLALSSAEDILLNTSDKAQSARVQMVKIVAEMSGKLRSTGLPAAAVGGKEKKLDAISRMGKAELIKLLEEQGLKVEETLSIEHITQEK